jgi:hypothetical protein
MKHDSGSRLATSRSARDEKYRTLPLVSRHGARPGDVLVSTNLLDSNADLVIQMLDPVQPLPDREGLADLLEDANLDLLPPDRLDRLERMLGWRGIRDEALALTAVAVTFAATPTREGGRYGRLAARLLAHLNLTPRGAEAAVGRAEQVELERLTCRGHAPMPGRFRILDPGTSPAMRPVYAALMDRDEVTYDDISQEALRMGLGGTVTFFVTYKSLCHVTDPARPAARRLHPAELAERWGTCRLAAHLAPSGEMFDVTWLAPSGPVPPDTVAFVHPAFPHVLFTTSNDHASGLPVEALEAHPSPSYLLSLLQKAVRRQRPQIAWAAAARLVRTRSSFHHGSGRAPASGLEHLLLRLPIIAVEDVALPPWLPGILWMGIAAAGGWWPNAAQRGFIRRFVIELAGCRLFVNHEQARDYAVPDPLDPVWSAPAEPPRDAHDAMRLTLAMRRALPGMAGDKAMLWRVEQLLADGGGLPDWPAAPGVIVDGDDLTREHVLALKEAVDMHCHPPMLNAMLLSSLDFHQSVMRVREQRGGVRGKRRQLPTGEEIVADWIWKSRSSFNRRRPLPMAPEFEPLERSGAALLEGCADEYLEDKVLPHLTGGAPRVVATARRMASNATGAPPPAIPSGTSSVVRLLEQLLGFPATLRIQRQKVVVFADPLARALVVILPGSTAGGKMDKAAAVELPFDSLELPFDELGADLETLALPAAYRGRIASELGRVRNWREQVRSHFPACRDGASADAWAGDVLRQYLTARRRQRNQPFRPTWWPQADLDEELFVYDADLVDGRWMLQRKRLRRAGKRRQREYAPFGAPVAIDPQDPRPFYDPARESPHDPQSDWTQHPLAAGFRASAGLERAGVPATRSMTDAAAAIRSMPLLSAGGIPESLAAALLGVSAVIGPPQLLAAIERAIALLTRAIDAGDGIIRFAVATRGQRAELGAVMRQDEDRHAMMVLLAVACCGTFLVPRSLDAWPLRPGASRADLAAARRWLEALYARAVAELAGVRWFIAPEPTVAGTPAAAIERALDAYRGNRRLFRHQLEALRWCLQQELLGTGAILASPMGMGKTIVMLLLSLCYRRPGVTLVVAPDRVIAVWEREMSDPRNWGPATPFDGARLGRDTADTVLRELELRRDSDRPAIVLTTYSTLTALVEANALRATFSRVVFDESHLLRNAQTHRTRAAHRVGAAKRWGVTGTPIQNRETDLWSQLSALAVAPYQHLDWWDTTSVEHRYLMLRRTLCRDVPGHWLEPSPMPVTFTALDAGERAAYQHHVRRHRHLTREQVRGIYHELLTLSRGASKLAALRRLVARLLSPVAESDHPLAAAYFEGRLNEWLHAEPGRLAEAIEEGLVEPHPISLAAFLGQDVTEPESGADAREPDDLVRTFLALAAGDRAAVWLPTDVMRAAHFGGRERTRSEKVLVFVRSAEYRAMVAADLRRAVGTAAVCEIDTTGDVASFQRDDSIRVGVATFHTAGAGVDLFAARNVVLLDSDWNPAVEDQAVARCSRIGQHHRVFVDRIVSKDTIEERMLAVLERKRAVIADLIGSVEAAADSQWGETLFHVVSQELGDVTVRDGRVTVPRDESR